jgi:TRAP-type C4-dicarboxylate transport system permease small subunit
VEAALGRLFKVVETVLGMLLLAMVLMVFGNVVLRYVFNSGILFWGTWRQHEINASTTAPATGMSMRGMVVNEISAAEMLRIRDRTRPVYEQHGKAIGDEALNLVFGELKRIRGN